MIAPLGRRQLPVYSPIDPVSLLLTGVPALGPGRGAALREHARGVILTALQAREVTLTDSGTSALVLALRLAAQGAQDALVAMPAYSCIDLASAAQRAGVRVRLYDLNPATLGPDEESVRAACRAGARAVVVAHLFGYPCDVVAIRAIASEHGSVLIEDAAQGAGGTLHGRLLGAHGELSVLSFGRGKGTSAGGGGALLTTSAERADAVRDVAASLAAAGGGGGAGLRNMLVSVAAWALGRPSLYALPSAIPALQLGEMVYHEAGEPRAMARTSAALVPRAFELSAHAVPGRKQLAERLGAEATAAGIPLPRPILQSRAGYLRLAVLPPAGTLPDARLGMIRPYPLPLSEHAEMRRVMETGSGPLPGAQELARKLVTVPVHQWVSAEDERRIVRWFKDAAAGAHA